ncbi:MAG: DUF4058 family protein [Planctomycetes bacterium]|nr:DUF4058 family protein [Planctomycetota bacterium]
MPSPFPGMDPYLEDPLIWEDFHAALAYEIRAQITPRLRPRYFAALIPRVTYEEVYIETTRGVAKPDVSVIRTSDRRLEAGAVAIAPAPMTGTVPQQVPINMVSVEIKEVGSGRLVTAIEILSPVNKRPGHDAHAEYVEKRRAFLRGPVNLLEIDLLRRGERFPTQDKLPDAPYFVFLHRGRGSTKVGIWPLTFTDPIPCIPLPLLEPDPDQPLDLGLAIANVYDRAAYELRIDYTKPPPKPGLPPETAGWLARRLEGQPGA